MHAGRAKGEMSLSVSVVMVKADAMADVRAILELFEGRPLEVERVTGWDAVLDALRYPRPGKPRETVHKAATLCGEWTVILDPEMLLMANEAACAALAARYRAPVFGMVCQGTSGTYAFSLYDPDLRRAYWIGDGEVFDNRGEPLPQEAGVDLASLFEDGVLEIMKRVGVDYAELEEAGAFEVWSLDESHLIPPVEPAPVKPKRPWWRIWGSA